MRTRLISSIVVTAVVFAAAGARFATTPRPHPAAPRVLYYHDPMHPSYRSDKPGIAPDCGMPLEPVYAEVVSDASDNPSSARRPADVVRVSTEQQQAIGLRVETVERIAAPHALRTIGRVALDDTRVTRVDTAVAGWVRTPYPVSVGTFVKKDQPLAVYFSPEVLAAEQSFLVGIGATARTPANGQEILNQVSLARAAGPAGQSALDRLRNLGLSQQQIDEISDSRQLTADIVVRSPVSGVVVARSVMEGQRLGALSELFRIADLTHVWIYADLFAGESDGVRPGDVAHIVVPQSDKTLRARVGDVLPQFNPTTRTMRVRLEADNPGYVLKPDMVVDVEVGIRRPPALAVPASAVRESGLHRTVLVQTGAAEFQVREVVTGWRSSDTVAITSGLTPGDRIVVAGNFLVDSETRLQRSAASPTLLAARAQP